MAQFRTDTQSLDPSISTRYEVVMLADENGNIVNSNNPIVANPSGVAVDAFGRLRTSSPLTLFDSSHRFRDNGLWVTSNTAGTTYAHNANAGLIELNLPTTANAEIVRETTKVFSYQPGKSLLVLNTFVMSPAKTGLTQRVGYYGADNGFYLEQVNSTIQFVKRSIVTGVVVNTPVLQSAWNGDKLDGTGPSGITLDLTKAQILWMDLEWLGVGSVRIGFVINGQFIVCHTFHHANLITSTYITTASLPLRYEIFNTAGTTSSSTLKQICSTVISEGGYELRGAQQAVGTPINAPKTLTTANTYYPIVSIRLKSTRLDGIAVATAISVIGNTSGNFNWQVIRGGTTTAGSWISAGTDSSVEYNLPGTSFTGGRILASGYFTATASTSVSVDILRAALLSTQLERNGLTGVASEFTLVLAAGTNGESVFGSIDWEEISR